VEWRKSPDRAVAVSFIGRGEAERTVREALIAVQQPQPRPRRSLRERDARHLASERCEGGLDLPGPHVVAAQAGDVEVAAAPSEWDGSM